MAAEGEIRHIANEIHEIRSGRLFRFAAGGLLRIQRWSAVVALLEVPRESRAAI
jgi:hypothetical protein